MRLTIAVALLVGGLAVLSAQQQQPIRVGTNFVRVDVYPTKDGQIVDGLLADDFEVLEDGVAQKIETFEHVVPTIGPHTARTEPSTEREMVQAVANGRNRLFLIFLDGPHVGRDNSRAIIGPLIAFMKKYVADDDLVAIMTPQMSASGLTFARKTQVLEQGLRTSWLWGRQDGELDPELDRRQIQYSLCYPNGGDVPAKMVARSRERATLEALQDAVRYLQSIREERKAIVTITEGWPLYREDLDMLRTRTKEMPLGTNKVGVGPTGQLTLEDHRNKVNALAPDQCDTDRMRLAQIDDDKFLRDIIDDANRGNASFYMIDPGGLSVSRSDRNGAMRTLAENTDGLAIFNSNDLERGFSRIASDMSSYYLLGYYATNTKTDGRFREITVRVKQQGVTVRARKGYRAPSSADLAMARRPAEGPAVSAAASPVSAAIDRLSSLRADSRLRVNAVASPGPLSSLWVAGELKSTGTRPDEFMQGAKVSIEAIAGGRTTTSLVILKPRELTFLVKLEAPAPTGMIDVRVRLSSDEGRADPLSAAARVDLSAAPSQPLMFRRGVTTGNRLLPAGDPVFSRTERARLEIPIGPGPRDGKPKAGRVLDRGGVATPLPVAVGERTDEGTGQRWITADVTLAALSPADYVIELVIAKEAGEDRVLAPIRVVR